MRDPNIMTTAQILAAFRDDMTAEGFDAALVGEAVLVSLGEMVRIQGSVVLGQGA